jgi:CHASE3 domain sensor protein
MPQNELITLMIIGGIFVLLGLGAFFWGKSEEKHYYESISSHQDTREFLEGWPRRPQFGSLQVGGWIAIILGVIMLSVGGAFSIWG